MTNRIEWMSEFLNHMDWLNQDARGKERKS